VALKDFVTVANSKQKQVLHFKR